MEENLQSFKIPNSVFLFHEKIIDIQNTPLCSGKYKYLAHLVQLHQTTNFSMNITIPKASRNKAKNVKNPNPMQIGKKPGIIIGLKL